LSDVGAGVVEERRNERWKVTTPNADDEENSASQLRLWNPSRGRTEKRG